MSEKKVKYCLISIKFSIICCILPLYFKKKTKKKQCCHLSEINNEVEDSIFFWQLFCNIKIRKPFELTLAIHYTSKRHFYNVRHVLYQALKFLILAIAIYCYHNLHNGGNNSKNCSEYFSDS